MAYASDLQQPIPAGAVMVSIIIRGKNGHDLTTRCIASIMENTPNDAYRLIVVDDGSDPAYDFPAHYAIRSAICNGAVTATNLGLGIALQQKDAPYILILDNDTEIPRGDTTWLSRFVAELEENPATGAIGATTNFSKGHQHALAAPATYTADWSDDKAKTGGTKANPEVAEFVSFAVLLRRDAVARVGFWDEQYNPGNFEDTDYAVQLRLSGWEVRVARSVYIHHHGHRTFGDDIQQLMRTNGLKFMQKWGPGHLWDLGLLPTQSLVQAVRFREGAGQ
jgi:O-antigen biosynthesis protein